MADNQTFEQWLNAQSNLTDTQRQALIAHNADATVTFTPESFDRYLTELRGQSSETRGGKANADNNSEDSLQAALTLANGDLSKMDYGQVVDTWTKLSNVDTNAAPELNGKVNEAKAKMAEYSERLLAGVKMDGANPQQPWTMDTAPEYASWLGVNKAAFAQSNDAAQIARNQQIQSSLVGFFQKFDHENGLENLNAASAKTLTANEAAVNAIGKDFDPFARNEQGELRHPEFDAVDKFYDKLEIDNSDKKVDKVDKDSLKKNMAELAYNEAVLELSMNSDFARLSKEQQEKLLADVYSSKMQAGMVTMIAAQMAEAASKQDQNPHKAKEFEDQAAQFVTAAVKGENNSFKVSNTAALANLAVRTTNLEHVSKRVAQKTGHKSFWQKIKDFDKKITQKYPKAYPMLKNMAISAGIGLATGGAGLAVYSAYKTAKAVQKKRSKL